MASTQYTRKFLRGFLYCTSRMHRCPVYHVCVVCGRCTMFSRHRKSCMICESRLGINTVCNHTDQDQMAAATITRILGRPMWDHNLEATDAAPSVANDPEWDELLEMYREATARGMGRLHKDSKETSKIEDSWKL